MSSIKELKSQHSKEIARLNKTHSEKMVRLNKTHSKEIAHITKIHSDLKKTQARLYEETAHLNNQVSILKTQVLKLKRIDDDKTYDPLTHDIK